jgi:hypothetical protein
MTTASEPINLSGVRFYTAWHLNLNYSSIEKADRPKVIEKCYWPILEIAEATRTPVGIEISGSSLEAIEAIDPSWIGKATKLADEGLAEFVGSGYCQIIAPLAPHQINTLNFVRGQAVLEDLLGRTPRIAYVNEQCASSGVLEALADIGFEAVIIEWENSWIANPHWSRELGYKPQRAGVQGNPGIIWNHSRFFQGLQRAVHRELTMGAYLELFRDLQAVESPTVCFYGGDAETFDFRAGRFGSESKMWHSEWASVSEAMANLVRLGGKFVLPSELLEELPDHNLEVFNVGNQIITKKQAKYNVTRWAVGGRANYELNNYAFSATAPWPSEFSSVPELSDELALNLWASDFRTHITESRWDNLLAEHPGSVDFSASNQPNIAPPKGAEKVHDQFRPIKLVSASMSAVFDLNRGLTIDSLATNCNCGVTLIGRLPFGAISGPGHSPDWYTGNVLFQEPGMPQDTELSTGVNSDYWHTNQGELYSRHENRSFRLSKRFRTSEAENSIDLEYLFEWRGRPQGIARAGLMTFLPAGWKWDALTFSAANGGKVRTTFPFRDREFFHGSSVSPLVTASNCIGLTDGGFSLSDGKHEVRVNLKPYSRGAVLLLDFQPGAEQGLLRSSFSVQEVDDTAKARVSEATALGFSISATCLVR